MFLQNFSRPLAQHQGQPIPSLIVEFINNTLAYHERHTQKTFQWVSIAGHVTCEVQYSVTYVLQENIYMENKLNIDGA